MIITHTDRNGKGWRFDIDCTERQGEKLRRALFAVRRMGLAENCSLSALLEEREERALFESIERAMLRGLADAFPVRQTPLRPLSWMRRRTPPPTPPPAPAPAPAADDEPAPGYWWEAI